MASGEVARRGPAFALAVFNSGDGAQYHFGVRQRDAARASPALAFLVPRAVLLDPVVLRGVLELEVQPQPGDGPPPQSHNAMKPRPTPPHETKRGEARPACTPSRSGRSTGRRPRSFPPPVAPVIL